MYTLRATFDCHPSSPGVTKFTLYSKPLAHGHSSNGGHDIGHHLSGHGTKGDGCDDTATFINFGFNAAPKDPYYVIDGDEQVVFSFICSVPLLKLKHGTQSVEILLS